jgi:hypothetical protein
MSTTASSGTKLSVSAGLPATHNEAGFAALTYTLVGELESVGDLVLAKAPVRFANLTTGKTSTNKGAEEPLDVSVVCALDRDDAGQTLMIAAYASTADYSFAVEEPDGTKIYFRGKVMKMGSQYGGINDVIKAPYDIGVTTPSSGNTLVIDAP